jgi:hypothetical protein
MLCWSGLSKSGQIRDVLRELQGHLTNQAYYKSGIMSAEYQQVNNHSRLSHIVTL